VQTLNLKAYSEFKDVGFAKKDSENMPTYIYYEFGGSVES
jgi:hypothetical protein